MRSSSPQMGAALQALRDYGEGSPFVRTEDGDWRPERFSTTPPRISAHTMKTLIERRYVRVESWTPRGAAERVRLAVR